MQTPRTNNLTNELDLDDVSSFDLGDLNKQWDLDSREKADRELLNLNLREKITVSSIERQFKKLALSTHPDKVDKTKIKAEGEAKKAALYRTLPIEALQEKIDGIDKDTEERIKQAVEKANTRFTEIESAAKRLKDRLNEQVAEDEKQNSEKKEYSAEIKKNIQQTFESMIVPTLKKPDPTLLASQVNEMIRLAPTGNFEKIQDWLSQKMITADYHLRYAVYCKRLDLVKLFVSYGANCNKGIFEAAGNVDGNFAKMKHLDARDFESLELFLPLLQFEEDSALLPLVSQKEQSSLSIQDAKQTFTNKDKKETSAETALSIKHPTLALSPIQSKAMMFLHNELNQSKYFTILQFLTSQPGIDINYIDPATGLTPVMQAIGTGAFPNVSLLIAKGASLNMQSKFGEKVEKLLAARTLYSTIQQEQSKRSAIRLLQQWRVLSGEPDLGDSLEYKSTEKLAIMDLSTNSTEKLQISDTYISPSSPKIVNISDSTENRSHFGNAFNLFVPSHLEELPVQQTTVEINPVLIKKGNNGISL